MVVNIMASRVLSISVGLPPTEISCDCQGKCSRGGGAPNRFARRMCLMCVRQKNVSWPSIPLQCAPTGQWCQSISFHLAGQVTKWLGTVLAAFGLALLLESPAVHGFLGWLQMEARLCGPWNVSFDQALSAMGCCCQLETAAAGLVIFDCKIQHNFSG